jgi:hypothetical protein
MAEVTTYERTQLWKEHTHMSFLRQSALKAATEYASLNKLELSLDDLMLLTKRFIEFLNDGSDDWVKGADKYFSTKVKYN